jgi:group I intron endonuclease
MFCVYCHTNKKNRKKYFGITSQKPEKRWANGRGYKDNEHFSNSIKKYGWDGFEHEILFTNLTIDQASCMEINLIRIYHTTDPNFGYNKSFGGECNRGGITEETRKKLSYSSSHISEQTREKHRQNLIRRNKTEKHRKAVSAASQKRKEQIRDTFSQYWHLPCSEETKEKLRIAHQKRVVCVETGEVFDSITLAAKSLGMTRNAVGNVLNGYSVSAKGFHFIYCDQESPKVRPKLKQSKKVICLETGEIFDSVKLAAERFGTCEANIKHCATGRYKKAKCFTFRYLENGVMQ